MLLDILQDSRRWTEKQGAASRDAQKLQADIQVAQIQAKAEEKKRADEIRMAQIKADKELSLKELELKAQAQTSTSPATTPTPRNKDAKSPKLPSLIDEKDKLDSYLLRFERYTENANWEKNMWAIKLSALLTGGAMDVYIRMSTS